jgi:GLPGLI family protein
LAKASRTEPLRLFEIKFEKIKNKCCALINISRIFAHAFCSCFCQLIYLLTQNQNVMKTLLLALLMLFSIACFAQTTDNYLVTYKVQETNPMNEINMDTMAATPENAQIKAFVQKMFQSHTQHLKEIELQLYCNATESLFVVKDALQSETMTMGNFGYMMALLSLNMTTDSKIYYNAPQKKSITQKTSSEVLYKISQPYQYYQWTITDTNKIILGHQCFKANALWEHYDEQSKKMNRRTLSAWFTKDIPLPFGPSDCNGLPGLVLEAIALSGNTFDATAIEEHYVDKIKILQEPKGGKEMSEAAFEAMEADERAKKEKEQGEDD